MLTPDRVVAAAASVEDVDPGRWERALDELFVQVGRWCAVLVGGPAGIGKTRLAEEAAVAGGGGTWVVWGREVDDAGTPPLWPWQRVFQAIPDVDATVRTALGEQPGVGRYAEDAGGARFRLAADMVDALVAAAEPAGADRSAAAATMPAGRPAGSLPALRPRVPAVPRTAAAAQLVSADLRAVRAGAQRLLSCPAAGSCGGPPVGTLRSHRRSAARTAA